MVGFLTGCADTRLHNPRLRRATIPRLTGNFLRGQYHFGGCSLHYIGSLLAGLFHREFTDVDLDVYPAHLPINVEPAWRGYKLSQRLMEAYLGQLCGLGISGVYLDTTRSAWNPG